MEILLKENLERETTFTYLGQRLAEDGDVSGDNIQCTARTETLEEGIEGSERPKNQLEGQEDVYKTVVRPAVVYGA